MGHKAHPIGLRLGIYRKWNSNWFFEATNYAKFLHLNLNIEKFFKGFFYFFGIRTLVIKCQIIKLATNHLFIFIFYYRLRKKLKRNFFKWKINKWKDNVENYFEKKTDLINTSINYFEKKKKNFFFQKVTLNPNFNVSIKKNFLKNFFFIIFKAIIFLKKFAHIYKKKFLIYPYVINLIKYFKLYLNKKKNSFKQISLTQIEYNFNKQRLQNIALNTIVNARFLTELFLNKRAFLEKKPLYLKKKYRKTFFLWGKENAILTKKKISFPLKNLKKFLTKLTNCKIKLIFLNTLSLTKFFFLISESGEKKKARYNILQIQRLMLNRFKYHAIFIKDFIHLAFISILLKSTETLVTFIGEQFKRLPKNRKQLKLLTFLQQTLKILCGQRKEFLGFKFQIKGRLNRRNRTRKWTFQKGILALQTSRTRIEYGYSEGWTRSGLIGIHIWFFYKKSFKSRLKKKILKYLTYSQKKKDINNNIDLQQPYIYKKKIKAIPHIQKFNFYKKKYVKTQSKKI